MRLSGIRYIYAARLSARAVLVQECFAILGIAVGVALLFASQVSSTSLARSVAQLNTQLVGDAQLQLQARGPEGFPDSVLARVKAIPGVTTALPVLERQINVIGPHAQRSVDLLGVDPSALRAGGPLLRRFSARQLEAQQAIALPAPLASSIGAGPLVPVKVQVGTRFVETLIGATLGQADIGGLVHSPVAVTSLVYAQRLTGSRGRLTRIFIHYDPKRAGQARAGLERIAQATHLNLDGGAFDTRLFAVAVAPESRSEELFSGISALVGFMFALNAMLVTVPARRRFIEDVRPHGATRWMTIQILLFDALVIGTLACVIGLALGDLLSIAVFHESPGYLAFAFPAGNNRVVTWQSVGLAVGAGMLAAVMGVLWPLREILFRPLQPMRKPARRWRRLGATRVAVGLLCLLVTTATLTLDTRAALIGNVVLLLALVCLLPLLFELIVRLFDAASRSFDGIGAALAVTELQTPQTRVRSLAIAATAAVAVFGIVEFQGTQANLRHGLDASARDLDSNAAIWITPAGDSSLLTTVAFEPLDVAPIARQRGVRAVGVYRGSFLNWGEHRVWVRGPPASAEQLVPASQLLDGSLALASARIRRGGWAVLSQGLAREHGLRVGDAFSLPSPRPQTLRVAALSTNIGWPPGAVILNSADYARAWVQDQPSAYTVQTAPGADVPSVLAEIRAVLPRGAGVVVESAAERERRHYALAAQGLSRVTQIRILVLVAAILAVVGAMASMIWQRRERIAFSKCHGFREGVLWRALLCESAVLLVAGSLIGAIFGLYAQLLGSHFLAAVTGFPIVFNIEGVAAIAGFAPVSIIAVAMLAVPGYLVVRVPASTVNPSY